MSEENEQQSAHIDFDKILETLERGIRRSDTFMGIGLNASEHTPPISHVLNSYGDHRLNLVKTELTDKEKIHCAEEFGKWIRGNGLRELLETFSIYMDQLYLANFVILTTGKGGKQSDISVVQFSRMGIGDKVFHLSKIVAISEEKILAIRALNQARNCYAHRLGRVGVEDVDKNTNGLSLFWLAMQLEGKEPNGNIILEPELYDTVFRDGVAMQFRFVEKRKNFQLGEELDLSKRELKEICLWMLILGKSIFKEMVELAVSRGAELINTTPDPSHT